MLHLEPSEQPSGVVGGRQQDLVASNSAKEHWQLQDHIRYAITLVMLACSPLPAASPLPHPLLPPPPPPESLPGQGA